MMFKPRKQPDEINFKKNKQTTRFYGRIQQNREFLQHIIHIFRIQPSIINIRKGNHDPYSKVGSAHYGLLDQTPAATWFCKYSFIGTQPYSFCLHIVHGCFHASIAELVLQTVWSPKPQIFTICLPIPSLHPELFMTSDLLSLTIVLSVLELHVNRIIQCIPFVSGFSFRIIL